MLVLLISCIAMNGQNTISVKKKEIPQDSVLVEPEKDNFVPVNLSGFYYSDPFTLSSGTPGEPPIDFRRMLIYVNEYNQVYIFHSSKPVKKILEKYTKNPDKFIEESGKIELAPDGSIFINSKSVYQSRSSSSFSTFKYVGDIISNTQFYLDYKATYGAKVSLKIYMYKY